MPYVVGSKDLRINLKCASHLEKVKSLTLWDERQAGVAQLVSLWVVVDGVIALDNELNLVTSGLVWTLSLVVVTPVNVVFTSEVVSRTSQETSRVLVCQLLVGDTKSAASVHSRFGGGQLVSFWVNVNVSVVWLNLRSVCRLVGARQVQDVVVVGLDSAKEGSLVCVEHKVIAVPLQQVVLENSTFVMSNHRKYRRAWSIETLIDWKGSDSRDDHEQVCKEKLHNM